VSRQDLQDRQDEGEEEKKEILARRRRGAAFCVSVGQCFSMSVIQ